MGLQAVGSHVSPPPLSDTHGLPRASNGSVLFLASKMDIANTKNVWQQELQDGFVAMDLPPQCGKRHWIRWFKIKYCVDNMNSYRASRIFNLTDFEVLSIEGPQPADDPTVKGRIRFSSIGQLAFTHRWFVGIQNSILHHSCQPGLNATCHQALQHKIDDYE
eukprot:m.76668 g.76668  ORF g.76668 m.76668 type:complete len:162 (+) comp12495_c1_seq2:259-744(+)